MVAATLAPTDRQILEVIPQSFKIDDQKGIRNPIDMSLENAKKIWLWQARLYRWVCSRTFPYSNSKITYRTDFIFI